MSALLPLTPPHDPLQNILNEIQDVKEIVDEKAPAQLWNAGFALGVAYDIGKTQELLDAARRATNCPALLLARDNFYNYSKKMYGELTDGGVSPRRVNLRKMIIVSFSTPLLHGRPALIPACLEAGSSATLGCLAFEHFLHACQALVGSCDGGGNQTLVATACRPFKDVRSTAPSSHAKGFIQLALERQVRDFNDNIQKSGGFCCR